MSSAAGAHIHPRLGLRPSRRLLRLASDDRLVQQIQGGSEVAFEVAFERHAPAILGFCRHMLGSQEEAEDAVQHTFAAAYSDLQRGGEREIALKPWLFTIARNRCLSLLRARREHASAEPELVTTGLAEQVEQRAELRQLLADLRELPDEQREALLLAEAGGLPQADIAAILGCEAGRVKGLVYRARSGLLARREARELACDDVRRQLANLRGGALRRNELRLHLRDCAGCRGYREQVRNQRKLLSVALPVAPTLGLKANVLAAVGIGGAGAAAGGAAVAGGAAGGAAGAGALGGAAKVAAVAAIAIGGVGGGTAVVVSHHDSGPGPAASGVVKSAPATSDRPAAATDRGQSVQGAPGAAPESGRGSEGGDNAHARHGRDRSGGERGGDDGQRGHGGGAINTPSDDTSERGGSPHEKSKPEHEQADKKGPTATQGDSQGDGGHSGAGDGSEQTAGSDDAEVSDQAAEPDQAGESGHGQGAHEKDGD